MSKLLFFEDDEEILGWRQLLIIIFSRVGRKKFFNRYRILLIEDFDGDQAKVLVFKILAPPSWFCDAPYDRSIKLRVKLNILTLVERFNQKKFSKNGWITKMEIVQSSPPNFLVVITKTPPE